tara:strand:+ start:150 stop:425 length:276 start_codon:yes stop_codon:yes gene_type:complete
MSTLEGDVTRKAVLIASKKMLAAREMLRAILTTGPEQVMATGTDLRTQLEQGNPAVLPYMGLENTQSEDLDNELLLGQITGGQNGNASRSA